ncbi:MAG: prepilin-type N-terminal cleavage/methylation domain-containing protein [Planctomycetota bacterium]|jgi:prepilin-type N-terminal cleavage/methylation domain-containing protein
MDKNHPRARGFTLVELIASIVIVATLAGVLAPVVMTSADAYDRATSQRTSSENAGSAMERVVRTLRATPPQTVGSPQPGITVADADRIVLGDGHEIELVGDTLMFTAPGESASALCQDVEVLELAYLGADGVTDTSATPASTQRIRVRLIVGGFELQTIVFLRIAQGVL